VRVSEDYAPMTADEASYAAPSAGSMLRQARESSGLSIDAVAQQLKLAPRQVEALENDDYAKLPGRTFVRGFMRNYARLMRIDPDVVLAALPGHDAADRPALSPAPRSIGEMPRDARRKSSRTLIAIPLALIAVVAVGVFYEFTSPQSDARRAAAKAGKSQPSAASAQGEIVGASSTTTTALPNPVGEPKPAAPGEATPQASGEARVAAQSSVAANDNTTPSPPPGDSLLVLTFKGSSWVEIKDRNGSVVLSTTGTAGTTQGVSSSALPLDVIIGNAPDVGVSFRGQRIDLAPYTRQNVARVSLK
jgi:cytoskeleton protein RodZ